MLQLLTWTVVALASALAVYHLAEAARYRRLRGTIRRLSADVHESLHDHPPAG